MEPVSDELLTLLQRHWGYSGFRAKQEDIVRSIIGGRDVAVIMPTGGGKSLCYQLPAVAMNCMCVVISPLIALMQDQAAHMKTARVPAAFLNSTLDWQQQQRVKQQAESGALRLLYISPERLVRADTLAWLKRLPIGFFAVDEAHCISEWGHEFRPEYRQLRTLRDIFPDRPIAAFTASATRHVRHDIVSQLRLNDPAKFVLSFRRPNLRYVARECAGHEQERLLSSAMDAYAGSNVIVYAPTIKSVESTAASLTAQGFAATSYHGQMESDQRRRNQELWMSGGVRVMVGTLAFGLGINKPDVRAVIHLALPKSLEQYYQEAGRAGRDGEAADCALLWQKRDTALLAHFNGEIEDPGERDRAWQRYRVIRGYTESVACRHRTICLHFGETPKWDRCEQCDVCGNEPEWLNAPVTQPAPKRSRTRVRAAAPEALGATVPDGLRERMREWRVKTAKDLGYAPFMVLHDKTLDEICRRRPSTLQELVTISGIGKQKAEQFGPAIIRLLAP